MNNHEMEFFCVFCKLLFVAMNSYHHFKALCVCRIAVFNLVVSAKHQNALKPTYVASATTQPTAVAPN